MTDSMIERVGLSALTAVQDFRTRMFAETEAEYLACKAFVAGRAAIEAMRTVTQDMTFAGWEAWRKADREHKQWLEGIKGQTGGVPAWEDKRPAACFIAMLEETLK